jgi:hypothetical protein
MTENTKNTGSVWNWRLSQDPLEVCLWEYIASRGDVKNIILTALKDRYLAQAMFESSGSHKQIRQTCLRSFGSLASQYDKLEEIYDECGGTKKFCFPGYEVNSHSVSQGNRYEDEEDEEDDDDDCVVNIVTFS